MHMKSTAVITYAPAVIPPVEAVTLTLSLTEAQARYLFDLSRLPCSVPDRVQKYFETGMPTDPRWSDPNTIRSVGGMVADLIYSTLAAAGLSKLPEDPSSRGGIGGMR